MDGTYSQYLDDLLGYPAAAVQARRENGSVASDLARRGLRVFPILYRRDKDEWTPIAGFPERASSDAAQVAVWWAESPDARVGLLTGAANGITVLDIDVKNGKDGLASLASPSAATSAFFSGISTGSLHGWAWFAAAFLGSSVGVRLSSFVFRAASSAPRAGVTNCPGEPSRLLIAGAVIVSVAIPTLADLVARPIDPYELQHQRRSAQALRRLAVIARRPDRLGERALVSLAASLPDGASASYGSPAARSHFRYEFPSGARIAVTRLCDGPIRNKSGRLSEIDSTAT